MSLLKIVVGGTSANASDAYFLRSPKNKLGQVECWFDNDKGRKEKIDGWW